jgi:hypothetical protein
MITGTIKFRIFLVAILFAVFLFTNEYTDVLYWDSAGYWNLSKTFFKTFSRNEQFSFYNFHDPLRGYSFPLILLPGFLFTYLTKISPVWIIKSIGIFWATLLFAWVLPAFWQNLTGRAYRNSIISFVLMLGFVIWSWGDYFSFTLTDFPAFTFFLLALICLRLKGAAYWLFAGIAFALALNFRPVYAAAIPSIALLAIYQLYKFKMKRLLCALGFGAGLLLVLLPQILINIHNFNSYSPLVAGKYDKDTSLYQWHLAWGMRVQRFECALVEPANNNRVVIVEDIAGRQLLQKVTGGNSFNSFGQYVSSVVKYPLDFTVLFARHIFCGLDISYDSPYMLNLGKKGVLFSIVNFSFIFFGIIMLKRVRFNIAGLLQLSALLLVVCATLPLVVEPRFVMPLHLLLVVAAAFGADLRAWWRLLRDNSKIRYQLIGSYCILLLGCFIIEGMVNVQTVVGKIGYFK